MKAEAARRKMETMIAARSTESLVEIVRTLNLKFGQGEMIVSDMVTKELERRMPEAAFVTLMGELEAEIDAFSRTAA